MNIKRKRTMSAKEKNEIKNIPKNLKQRISELV